MKLWQKDNTAISAVIESFTVGRDKEFDLLLAPFDLRGSIAHVRMLGEKGLMGPTEVAKAVKGLEGIAAEIEAGSFTIEDGVEDVHSQVELMLTRRIGEVGKMIHSGRSRNDQVATDIKLFLRDAIAGIRDESKNLFDLLLVLTGISIGLQRRIDRVELDILEVFFFHLDLGGISHIMLRSQHSNMGRITGIHRPRQNKNHLDTHVAHGLRQSVTGRAQTPADEGRKLPTEHEYFHSTPPAFRISDPSDFR